MIDIDAIPLDLSAKERRPVGTAYVATVRTFPDGSVAIVPHHVADTRPTLAHGRWTRPRPTSAKAEPRTRATRVEVHR